MACFISRRLLIFSAPNQGANAVANKGRECRRGKGVRVEKKNMANSPGQWQEDHTDNSLTNERKVLSINHLSFCCYLSKDKCDFGEI